MGLSTDLLTNTLLATRAPVVDLPGDAHRDVGTPGRRRQHRRAARSVASTSSSPRSGGSPAATSAPGGSPIRRRSSPRSSGCSAPRDLAGVRVVVIAGGTREPIDAVRVIANRSSGKQGYAVAAEAAARGAEVTLVSTVDLPAPAGVDGRARSRPPPRCRRRWSEPADDHDVIVMAAAVADFRPAIVADGKLKKHDGAPADRARADARHPRRPRRPQARRVRCSSASPPRPTTCVANATAKLVAKHLDLIVANDVGASPALASNTTPMRLRCCGPTRSLSRSTSPTSEKSHGPSSTRSSPSVTTRP